MVFFTILLVTFVLLILISIVNTFIFMALNLVTRVKYQEHYLILPSFLALIIWFLAYISSIKIIASTTGTSIFDAISASILNTSSFSSYLPKLIFPILIILVLTLLLQSVTLLTINIDYTKMFNKIRYFIKQMFRTINNNSTEEIITKDIEQINQKYKLTFGNSFICTLFIFTFLFFLGIIFFWIGTLIGNTII